MPQFISSLFIAGAICSPGLSLDTTIVDKATFGSPSKTHRPTTATGIRGVRRWRRLASGLSKLSLGFVVIFCATTVPGQVAEILTRDSGSMWSKTLRPVGPLTGTVDLDNDGIFDSIDPNPGVTDPKITVGGADYTFVVLGSGRVATLQISAALFDDFANGMTRDQMHALTSKVYLHFQDVFDFILFTSRQTTIPSGSYAGIHIGARNDTQGIGLPIYDKASAFGSAGRLQAGIHLTYDGGLSGGPSLHEIMHRWGNFLQSVPSVSSAHWGYSSVGGQLGGWQPGSLESLGGDQYRVRNPVSGQYGSFGTIANGGNSLPFSELELYLMGMIPATGLHDVQIANDFEWLDMNAGRFRASSITTVPMSAVIATDGARIPDHLSSQKDFRAMHVILVKEPVENAAWARYDKDVYLFSLNGSDNQSLFNFWEATGGRATLAMGGLIGALSGPIPTPTPTASATATPIVTPTPGATPTATPGTLGNISTRLRVLSADSALIGGLIATGTGGKRVIVRAIGPSLIPFGVPGALANPTLDLFQGSTLLFSNDDWNNSTQQAEVAASGLAPSNAAESAIIWTLTPGQNYTAVVRGINGTTGIGVVEAFDLDRAAASKLGNISTRGFVDVDDDVMIAGLIAGPGNGTSLKILVRALGPTLSDFGVAGALANPTLDLVNASGTVIRSNDNWKDDPQQRSAIEAAGLAPSHDEEAALVETAAPGAYTAIVRGSGRAAGVGLVEAYNIP
jgi:hypothetical protein